MRAFPHFFAPASASPWNRPQLPLHFASISCLPRFVHAWMHPACTPCNVSLGACTTACLMTRHRHPQHFCHSRCGAAHISSRPQRPKPYGLSLPPASVQRRICFVTPPAVHQNRRPFAPAALDAPGDACLATLGPAAPPSGRGSPRCAAGVPPCLPRPERRLSSYAPAGARFHMAV